MADGEGEWAEEENEEGNWDEDGEWGDEGGEWDDDWDESDEDDWDEDEDDDDDEDGGVLQRVAMGGPNRQRNPGIHTIEIYYPQFYFKQIEMEEYDSRPDRYGPSVIGKYTKGIGQVEARFPTDDEDPVSFAMTVTHRIIERMDRLGFNETAKFHPEGKTIPPFNAFGRIDIGSESLLDRSKSMKSYVMDMFERYGDGEHNIEGVDMYNACYGGQAAGLCCQNWIEGDRWDGRYGLAIATDISDTVNIALFTVGAACTGTLYFPDAPVPHHGLRSSSILNRFDFFKPVGWKHMGPVVDGKYSIDAYMTCIDLCYHVLKKKMNDRPIFQVTDYNVFHTGGGFHIVKKSFERMCRADDPTSSHEDRQKLTETRLMPSVHLLKIIGPCHTVSSFLNIASVIMSQWEKSLGKVLIVFTYGSGCASSMYQLRFDELAWMSPLAAWKIEFYREAIYQYPSTYIHDIYTMTWMKFDYKPQGRIHFQIDPWLYQLDVYYLMEIDKWGRRFYHRGGIIAPAIEEKYMMRHEAAEGRPRRSTYLLIKEKPEVKEKPLEDQWKEIEYDMVYDESEKPEDELVQEGTEAKHDKNKIVVLEVQPEEKPQGACIEHDGQEHTYQIVGSWSGWEAVEDMDDGEEDGSYQFTVTVGENGWEEFHLIQDRDKSRKIYPAYAKSWKSMPCVGPHRGGEGKNWRIDTRDLDTTQEEDLGKPGDQYLVTFTWKAGSVKNLEWDKLEDEAGEYARGQYYVAGTWTCWDFVELQDEGGGKMSCEATLTWLGLEFVLARNKDMEQMICPEVELGDDGRAVEEGESGMAVLGPDSLRGMGSKWNIKGSLGDVYRISFFRDPDSPAEMGLSWAKLRSGPAVEPEPRYFLVGAQNNWGQGGFIEMRREGGKFSCSLTMQEKLEPFRILLFKRGDKCIHPDKNSCSQIQAHKVLGPDTSDPELYWAIGKAAADKARLGDTFVVSYSAEDNKVTWKKRL